MRGKRGRQETTVTARVHERGEEFRVAAARRGAANEPHHRILRPPVVDFDLRIDTISGGQVWIELECTIERGLCTGDRLRFAAELARDAVELTQPCPRGCVMRIDLHGLLI